MNMNSWFGRDSNPHSPGFNRMLDLRAAEPFVIGVRDHARTRGPITERAAGVEPAPQGLEDPDPTFGPCSRSHVRALAKARDKVEPLTGVEPVLSFVPRRRRPTTTRAALRCTSAATGGVEPPSLRLTGGRSAIELRRNVDGADGERVTEVMTRRCPEGPSSTPAREHSRSRTHPCRRRDSGEPRRHRCRTVKEQGRSIEIDGRAEIRRVDSNHHHEVQSLGSFRARRLRNTSKQRVPPCGGSATPR